MARPWSAVIWMKPSGLLIAGVVHFLAAGIGNLLALSKRPYLRGRARVCSKKTAVHA